MQEKYSNGFHSEIYRLNPKQKLWFPSADLVKIDESTDKNWFARLFYRHKIASLLFPDNFIEVVGAQVDPWEKNLVHETRMGEATFREPKQRIHRLFSKMASVPENHAVFSEHMDINFGTGSSDRESEKVSLHDCVHCKSHREFHRLSDIKQKAIDIASPMQKIGILPPSQDPSDYCLTREGNIVFFEINDFDEEVLEAHLSSLSNPNEMEERVLVLLHRLNELHKDSRLAAFNSGIGGEIRLN